MRSAWVSRIAAIATAFVGGLAEYVMTGETSTWIPLLAGLVGAVFGLIVSIILLPRQEGPFYTPRTVSELTNAVSGITSIEADTVRKPHIGSRIKVSGVITDISAIRVFIVFEYLVRLEVRDCAEAEEHKVVAVFGRRYSSKLRTLRACTTLLLGEGYTSGPDVVLGRPTKAQQCYPTDLTAAQWAQWPPCCHHQGSDHRCATSSGCSAMPSCRSCGVAAPGDCGPMTFRPGRRSTSTAASGVTRGSGRKECTPYATRSASDATGRWRPGPSSATASRSRRPQKGAAWRR